MEDVVEIEESDNDNADNSENEAQTGDTSKFILTFVYLIHIIDSENNMHVIF